MVMLQLNGHSRVLGTGMELNVLMPDPTSVCGEGFQLADGTSTIPVLYLLHGLSDDQTAWSRFTSLERYLEGYGVAAVMPAVGRSFCVDMRQGSAYGRFLAEELPSFVQGLLSVSMKPEHTFLLGVDTGGYGAFHMALSHPERYAAAAAISAPLNLETLYGLPDDEIQQELARVFGPFDACRQSGCHLQDLLERAVSEGVTLPRMVQFCGREDFFLADNRAFSLLSGKLNAGILSKEGPGGHDWGCWDAILPQIFAIFFPWGKTDKNMPL